MDSETLAQIKASADDSMVDYDAFMRGDCEEPELQVWSIDLGETYHVIAESAARANSILIEELEIDPDEVDLEAWEIIDADAEVWIDSRFGLEARTAKEWIDRRGQVGFLGENY